MRKSTILQALQHLGELALDEGVRLEVSIYGGAAFLLAYNSREATSDPESFGRNVRDWQHELRHVTSRKDFAQRIADAPKMLSSLLLDSGQCDAYLAAYVEWLCDRHQIPHPKWLVDSRRKATKAWFDYPPLWQDSFIHAPGAFRRRGVFTRPEDVLQFRKGRPKVSDVVKRAKSAERQRNYRARLRRTISALSRSVGRLVRQLPGSHTYFRRSCVAEYRVGLLFSKIRLRVSCMNDAETPLETIKKQVLAFARERDWEQFHSPKNLSMAIATEASELMEHFLWQSPEASLEQMDTEKLRSQVAEELADVFIFAIEFANMTGLDIASIIEAKMERNAEKYPVDKAKGRSTKYTNL